MGAFCVFGVSRTVCRKLAEKNVPTFVSEAGKKVRHLSAAEWGGAGECGGGSHVR